VGEPGAHLREHGAQLLQAVGGEQVVGEVEGKQRGRLSEQALEGLCALVVQQVVRQVQGNQAPAVSVELYNEFHLFQTQTTQL